MKNRRKIGGKRLDKEVIEELMVKEV